MKRWYYDTVTGLATIQRAPPPPPTKEEVELWVKTGVLARFTEEEPPRCPTCGRASDCCCQDCPYCDEFRRPTKLGALGMDRRAAQERIMHELTGTAPEDWEI